MKWYFAISEASLGFQSHDWPGLIKVAVATAQAHTQLAPHMIYDGQPNALTRWLERRGVVVIPHGAPFIGCFEALAKTREHGREWLAMAAGAFLRIEISQIERDEQFVLYTDCDVMFQPGFTLDDVAPPSLFAATGEKRLVRASTMNSGVMLINVPAMRREYIDFVRFIEQNATLGLDQEMLRAYFGRRFDLMPESLNWFPYRGVNAQARIVHFHGPKPAALDIVLAHPEAAVSLPEEWRRLFQTNVAAYRHYTALWQGYAAGLSPE